MRATSPSRSTEPSGRVRTTIASNSSGSESRPRVVSEYWNCWPGGAGGSPTVPAATCWFCSRSTSSTSWAETPSFASLSGSSQTRIE
jgi:hypothetical protein